MEQINDDEITLIDLLAVIWKWRWLIIGITGFAMIAVFAFTLIGKKFPSEKPFMPDLYTASAQILIKEPNPQWDRLSTLINSNESGNLTSMTEISTKGQISYASIAASLVTSNSLLDALIAEVDSINHYKITTSNKIDRRKAFAANFQAVVDNTTGNFTLSFTDRYPVFAQKVVNYAVDYLKNRFIEMGFDKSQFEKSNLEQNIHNTYTEILRLQSELKNTSSMPERNMLGLELKVQEQVYIQLKAQYELLKIKLASETPAFQILERADVSDTKSKPSRSKICLIVTFAAAFMSVFIAFLLNAISNIRKDEKAMAKFRR